MDTKETTIGRGTWIDKLAHEMILRQKDKGQDMSLLRVESGLGASGIPHIGSLGDAVRAFGVKMALEDMGYKSELIAYSDDMDGLRKIPKGFPDSLEEHLAKPVSMIPDPFGCHDSYGMHMSSLLLDGLDSIGIKYKFQRARDTYKQGLLEEQIHTILSSRKRIGARIAEMVGQEKYQKYLPYYPVCAKCGRLYTAQSHDYIEDQRKVQYRCQDTEIGSKTIKGCGHQGYADIAKDLGKLAWKVEFAARWSAFDIRFEAYGKDIMDSVHVNDWVAEEILGFAHPHHVKYEMFLDKGGKKISKSQGNVLTAQKWLRYGSARSILLLLYKRITGARELGLEDIPALMDEYNELEDIYFGRKKIDNPARMTRLRGLYEYVNLLEPPESAGPHVSYRLVMELAGMFREDRVPRVAKKLLDYNAIKEHSSHIDEIIRMAGNYADDFDAYEKSDAVISEEARPVLDRLASALDAEPEDIQNTIYQAAKTGGVPPKEMFKTLYQIILGTDRGPKIGPFIADIGCKKAARMIRSSME